MPAIDPRVDAFIEKSADFAKPILLHIRKLVHTACPDTVETIKWGFPHFDHKGMLCAMSAFKQHCAFGFWKQSLLEADAFSAQKTAMGSFGRITSVEDLPADDIIIGLVHQAVELNEKGIKVDKKPTAGKKELVVPDYLTVELKKNKAARETFENFPYSCKKEYVQWITEAKTDATRDKRLATTLEWLAEGKRRNWKYENC
ncbi:MAG: YdeI/OmpD-associated family protein [Acidobacteriota bacterium]